MTELFDKIACGDKDAVAFIRNIDFVADVWDDIIDCDKHPNDRRINDAFRVALVDIPRNPFYRRHFEALNAMVAIAIENWELATQIEREKGGDEVSFVIRSSFVDIFGMVAVITGGHEHAKEVIRELRAGAHAEGMAGYMKALEAERNAREGN
jgi:hypothetical protein